MQSNDPAKLRDFIRQMLNPALEQLFAVLPDLIKNGLNNGDGFQQVMGCSFFDYLQKEENKPLTEIFDNSMVTHSHCIIVSMGSAVDFNRFDRIADISGGYSKLFSTVIERSHKAHGL